MGFFTPFYMKSFITKSGANYKLREKACKKVANITDQNKLGVIAREALDSNVRYAAVEYLRDTDLLADIADRDPEYAVRSGAFKRLMKLGDEAALAKALVHSEGLGWSPFDQKNRNEEVLEHIHDQRLIAQIALKAKSDDARLFAVRRLDDQAALAEVARHETDGSVRGAAVMRLTDSALLAELAQDEHGPNVRQTAIANPHMTDAALLAKLALEDPESGIRYWAVKSEHLSDAAALAHAALEDDDPRVRRQAVENPNMTDPAVLAKVALTDADSSVRWEAVQSPYMTDPAALAEVARREEYLPARVSAVENPHFNNPAALIAVALENDDPRARKAAVEKIDDSAVLQRIALEDEHGAVREAAVVKVTDIATLKQVALTGKFAGLYRTAVDRIDDPDILEEIARSRPEAFPHPNWLAALRLSKIAPDRAVALLVGLLESPEAKDPKKTWPADLPYYCRDAIAFLMRRYRESDDPEVKGTIASLPNGRYGYHDFDECNKHNDQSTHFDLTR